MDGIIYGTRSRETRVKLLYIQNETLFWNWNVHWKPTPMIAPAWGRPIEPWKEGESRKLKDCLQKKMVKKNWKKKKKGDRQRPIPFLFLISVPNINNFTLISSLTFISPCILVIFNGYYLKLRPQRKNPVLRSLPSFVLGSCYRFQSKFESYFTCHARGLQRNQSRSSRLVTFRNQWLRKTQEISSSMSLEIDCYIFLKVLH